LMLARRADAEELMDAENLDPQTYAEVVHELARVNTLTLARRPTLGFLGRVAKDRALASGPLRILDVGFGDGDMLRAVAQWASHAGVRVALTGIDLNSRSLAAARQATPPGMGIDWRIGDYADLAGQQWDVIISSLVAHHMSCAQLVAFLRFMDTEAQAGWLINDLHRHGFAYFGFPALARTMRWHPIVRHDGQLSIARSYRPREWLPILAEAEITNARVYRAFPFRLCVEKRR